MATIEQRPTTGVILQEFTYKKPSEDESKTIFFQFGAQTNLPPNMTQGVIEGEWHDEKNGRILTKVSKDLWNKTRARKLETLMETASVFAKCNQVKIFEILPL